MEDIVYKIFDTRMFENILFVAENPASVKTEYTWKKDGELVKTQIENIYDLNSKVEFLDKEDEEIIDIISHRFFITLNFKWINKEVKYFKRNIIKKIFKRQNVEDILKHIRGYDWIITSDKIINELKNSNEFDILDSKNEIQLVGVINNTLIYRDPINDNSYPKQEDAYEYIYLGNKDSITPVFKIDPKGIEYTYHINGNLNKLIVS